MNAESLVQLWEQGQCDLAFNIDFYFKPTKETIKNVKINKIYFDKEVPLFNINFLIHKRINDADNSVLVGNLRKDSVYMQRYFSEVYKLEPKITLDLPCGKNLTPAKTEYGLFSDRKSALNFKNNILPKVMDEQGDKIMDVLSILNMKADKVDEILDFYKKVTLNYLYRSEIPHYVSQSSEIEKYFFDTNKDKDIRS